MSVTVDDIAGRLGVAAPPSGSPQFVQWTLWIADAEALISERAESLGVTVDQDRVDRVVALAVVAMARRPSDETEVSTVAVDDASVTKRYSSGRGEVFITDDWWARLGLAGRRGAFSIRPSGTAGYAAGGCW